MAVADQIDRALGRRPKLPTDVDDRLKRGRDNMKRDAPARDECLAFWRGDQYKYVNAENYLVSQSTVTGQDGQSGKPAHRERRKFNLIAPVVGHKVSQATSRVPGYEVNPSTVDSADEYAARTAAKIARYLYDHSKIRQATVEVATYALVADEGFAWPYWDTTIGPFAKDDDGKVVGRGDVRVRVFGPNEVFWEPGQRFDESRWHAVEQARTPAEVKQTPGYLGGDLTPNADTGDGQPSKLVLTTDYLERPCPEYPNGRWITAANGKVICEQRDFPCRDHDGVTLDEPVLHKLWFITDPDSDRDMGLVRFLVDPQRVFNHVNNKQMEWVKHALIPQLLLFNAQLRQKRNDVPGAVLEVWGNGKAEWAPVPQVPPELSQIKQETKEILQFIAADKDVPPGLEAARSLLAWFERSEEVWADFYANLADFHSRLARHCLYLVQQFWTTEELVKVRGDEGIELIPDFLGANLRGQADVTVLPGSITPLTRERVEKLIWAYAEKGWVSPEAAMAALNGGSAETLVLSYERDVARARRMLRRIKMGPAEFLSSDLDGDGVPDWMPRKFDNVRVHKTIFEDHMKTEDYDYSEPPVKEALKLYYAGLEQFELQQQIEAAQQQELMAQSLGMANAAAPQGPSPLPDQPSPLSNGGQPQ